MSSTHVRDEGLRRVSSITRWVGALGVAGTALIAAVVYHATPGRASTSTASPTAQAGVPDPNATGSVDPNAATAGFQAPVDVPVPVQQAPIVRSGGS